MIQALQQFAELRLGSSSRWVEALALRCGLDVQHYLGRHSMLPLTHFLGNEHGKIRETGAGWPDTLLPYSLLVPEKRAAFCPKCVQEELERRPYSVWRRSSQLPFRFRCAVHADSLLYAEASDAFMHDPALVLRSGEWRRQEIPAEWLDSEGVFALDAVTEAMLRAGKSWSRRQVWARLRLQANRRRVRLTPNGSLPTLSDVVLDRFPKSFLDVRFPVFRQKERGRPLLPIDNVLFSGQSTQSAVALALTVLYSKADKALQDLRRPVVATVF